MAGSSFALDSFDRNDLALDLLDTDSLFLPFDIVGTSCIPLLGDIEKYKVVT